MPSDAQNGQIITVKNYHIGTVGPSDDFKITVRPAQGQTPAHKLDYKFDTLELLASSSASTLMDSPNEAAKLVFYALDATWITVQDAY